MDPVDYKALVFAWVTGIVRHAISGVVMYFVAKGVITDEIGNQTIAGIVMLVANLAWSLIEKYRAQVSVQSLRGRLFSRSNNG